MAKNLYFTTYETELKCKQKGKTYIDVRVYEITDNLPNQIEYHTIYKGSDFYMRDQIRDILKRKGHDTDNCVITRL